MIARAGARGQGRSSSTNGSPDQEVTEVRVPFEGDEGRAGKDLSEEGIQLQEVEVAE